MRSTTEDLIGKGGGKEVVLNKCITTKKQNIAKLTQSGAAMNDFMMSDRSPSLEGTKIFQQRNGELTRK